MSRRRKSRQRKHNSTPQLQLQRQNRRQPEQSQLREAYNHFVEEVAYAREEAEREAYAAQRPAYEFLDLSRALDVLNANPPLMTYMQTVVERRQATEEARAVDFASVASGRKFGFDPRTVKAGASAASETNDLGAVGTGRQMTLKPGPSSMSAVPNADILRAWAEQVEWVRAAINIRREQVGRAAVIVRPIDETKPYDKVAQTKINALLDSPNEYRESLRMLIESVVEDILVLDRGVIEKNMTPTRQPTAMYASDGALFKIYTGWSGNPNEPRYLYEDPITRSKIPLRNDEVIMICANPATYRFGLSPVQVLRKAILADIKATESAMHVVEGKPPQHIVQMPKASRTQLQKVRDTYDQEVAGRRELLFVGGEETIHLFPLMFSAKDSQWMEWQVYLARKIATIFQISPQQLGITADINKATGEVQLELYEDTGLIPLMLLVEEYLNRELLADFAPTLPDGRPDFMKLNLQIVFPAVSEADRIMHVERMVAMSKDLLGGSMPSATLNQVLSMRGEEPVDGGDSFWVYTAKNGQVPWLSYDPNFDWLAANGLNPDGSRAVAPLAADPNAAAADDSAEGITESAAEADEPPPLPGTAAPGKKPTPAAPAAPAAPAPSTPPSQTTPAHPNAPAPPAKQQFWGGADGRRAGVRWSMPMQREAAQLLRDLPYTELDTPPGSVPTSTAASTGKSAPVNTTLDLDEIRRQLEDEIRKKLLEEFSEHFRAARQRKAQADGQSMSEPPTLKYSPDQSRDSHGRFGEGSGDESGDEGSSGEESGDSSGAMSTEQFSSLDDIFGAQVEESRIVPDDNRINEPEMSPVDEPYSPDDRTPQQTKADVARSLGQAMKDDPGWPALREKLLGGPYGVAAEDDPDAAAASILVHSWAMSSSDDIVLSNAMQLAAQNEFSLGDANTSYLGAADQAADTYGDDMPTIQHFMRAQYDATQALLKQNNVTEILGYRGIAVPEGTFSYTDDGPAQTTGIEENPVSSWTTSVTVAEGFANAGAHMMGQNTPQAVVLAARIPASRVMSTCMTGLGCRNELEFTVLGGQDEVWSSSSHSTWGSSAESSLTQAMVKGS